jgi:hypothetical protein
MADTGERQEQDRELYPILPLNREVLHCNTPPTPKRSRKKKRNTQTAGQKNKCSPQKRSADALPTIFSWSSTHRRIADILSFPPRARPPLNYYPITFIRSLGAKKNKRVLQGTVVLHTQYPARVTNNATNAHCTNKLLEGELTYAQLIRMYLNHCFHKYSHYQLTELEEKKRYSNNTSSFRFSSGKGKQGYKGNGSKGKGKGMQHYRKWRDGQNETRGHHGQQGLKPKNNTVQTYTQNFIQTKGERKR